MTLKTLILLLVSTTSFAADPIEPVTHKLFGVGFRIQAESPKLSKEINDYIKSKISFYQAAFDPDCFYKGLGNTLCGKEQLPPEFATLIEKIKTETQGKFQLEVESKSKDAPAKIRDYGGIAQGAVLEELARKFSEKWYGNFAGDIFISPNYKAESLVYISDSILPDTPYAAVDMNGGWISSSVSPDHGGKVRNAKKTDFDFDKIVLLANSNFNGARLDAWSTALVEGGIDLLRHLKSLKEFQGQWTYLYFDNKGKIVCSPELTCELSDSTKRIVRIDWEQKSKKR